MAIFRDSDVCSTSFLILILVSIGGMMVQNRPHLHNWGLRLSAGAFIAFVVFSGMEEKAETSKDWAALAFRGLFAAGLMLGIAWIVLPILAFLCFHLIQRPSEVSRRWWESLRRRRLEKSAKRQAERREALAKAAYDRTAPERDRARQEAEARAKAMADAQRRRENARASALLSFSFYAAKLGDRFPRPMFDQYVEQYMGDGHPPEVVEERARDLIAIFDKHLADVQPPKKAASIQSITRWYEDTKAQISALPLDDEVKEVRIADLERRFADLLGQHLEGMEP